MKIFPKIDKQQKHFIIEINILDIEEVVIKICDSMHVTTNLKKKIYSSTIVNVGQ